MRGSCSWRQRGPLRLYTTEVNGKCLVEHILSHSSVGSVEMITLSEVFSIPPAMCHHMPPTQPPSLGGSDDSVCSSAVGQKHETTLSGSLIATVKFRHHRWSELAFFIKSVGYVHRYWGGFILKWMLSVLFDKGEECWCVLLFFCANSSLCHVCPWCPKIHKE